MAAELIQPIFTRALTARDMDSKDASLTECDSEKLHPMKKQVRKIRVPWSDLLYTPDPRPLWKRYNSARGLPLREASIFYGDEYDAERYTRLMFEGFDVEPDYDPWDRRGPAEFYLNNVNLRQSRNRLEHGLIQKLIAGELVATGYASNASLDEKATRILPDRWRTLTPDFTVSTASAPGLTVTGILVFNPNMESAESLSKTGRSFSQAELKRWYRQWIAECEGAGRCPTRDDDWKEARRVFERPIPRDVLRILRRSMAPSSWTRKGRRSGGG